jgi:hypothetical protein
MEKTDEKKTENGKERKGKNIISRIDKGDYIEEKRKVQRAGMEKEIVYDLKIPKSLASAKTFYGEDFSLALLIASLRTENDDSMEKSGKPASAAKILKKVYDEASDERKSLFVKILKGENLSPEELKALGQKK